SPGRRNTSGADGAGGTQTSALFGAACQCGVGHRLLHRCPHPRAAGGAASPRPLLPPCLVPARDVGGSSKPCLPAPAYGIPAPTARPPLVQSAPSCRTVYEPTVNASTSLA